MPPPPANCRCLIRLASWILPRSRRTAWRHQWEHHLGHWHAFLVEHGQWDGEARIQLLILVRVQVEPNYPGSRREAAEALGVGGQAG